MLGGLYNTVEEMYSIIQAANTLSARTQRLRASVTGGECGDLNWNALLFEGFVT